MDSIDTFRSKLLDEPPPNPRLARGLGIFSLSLGAVGLAHPRAIARVVAPHRRATARRVVRAVGAGLAIAGVMTLDLLAARRARRRRKASPAIVYSVTINKSPNEVYAFFRTLSRLPLFMDYLESVTEHGNTSHWVAKLPLIGTVAWDARLKADRPGQLLEWETVPGSTIKQYGRVTFTRAPGRNATELRLELRMGVRGTPASDALAKLLAKPEAKGDLRRLKQVIETGEVLYSDASEHTRPYPAQPARHGEHKRPRLFAPNPPTARKEGVR